MIIHRPSERCDEKAVLGAKDRKCILLLTQCEAFSEGRAGKSLRKRAQGAGFSRRPGAAWLLVFIWESRCIFIVGNYPGVVRAPAAKAAPLDKGPAADRANIGKLTLRLDPECLPSEKVRRLCTRLP